ncbi:hypothetical protein BJ986_000515 [Phycicoccus badiiscoriae]|uniref:DUF2550 family protein n=1 Tax=Pedococcus badiiscoriae TaxID=642776 RepID=A0A852WAG0_9MICO|nr:DUF2550 family protein [Pedococcus badiiscoriae]NYG06028.1 hypothetical protein [Pedococcus badiiscoriae]
MSPVVSAEVVAGALILFALLALTYIFVRRRLLASGAPLMLCAIQPQGRDQYRLGLLRFCGGTLEWFTLIGPSPRSARTWDRTRLELGPPTTPATAVPGLPDAVAVDCHYGTDLFSLALAPSAYTAVRSWVESSPPGFNVNVA